MRSFIFSLAALALATAASSATPAGPYTLDSKGKCHAASGQFVAASFCATPMGPYKLDAKGKCHAANGQFVATNFCKKP